MVDRTEPSPAALTLEARAHALKRGIFGDVQQWPGKTRWFAAAFEGTALVRMCAHLHASERAARKCAARLVLLEARDDLNRGRLFS